MRRCLVSTRGTRRGVKLNSLPITADVLPRMDAGSKTSSSKRSKHQAPQKHQTPSSKFKRAPIEVWNLVFPWSLVLEIWSFGTLHLQVNPNSVRAMSTGKKAAVSHSSG